MKTITVIIDNHLVPIDSKAIGKVMRHLVKDAAFHDLDFSNLKKKRDEALGDWIINAFDIAADGGL